MPIVAWHYTTGTKVVEIVKDGFLKPSSVHVDPPEHPILWFSIREDFEPTASKAVVVERGALPRTLSVVEGVRSGRGLYRFGVGTSRLIPWLILRKRARMPKRIAKGLVAAGRKLGSNPNHWFGSLKPIRVDDCIIETARPLGDESWEWVPLPDVPKHNWPRVSAASGPPASHPPREGALPE